MPANIKHKSQEKEETVKVDEILAKIQDFMGFIPRIFQVLSENPNALKIYFEKLDMIAQDDCLSPLTKEFISIGAASALGAEHCFKTHNQVARKFGATNDQILLAIMIGAFITETNALANSLRIYEEFKG